MNPISAGNLMVSNIRVTGAAIQRDDPKILFQSGFFTSPHPGGQYHAYAVSADGQRFLIPQLDNPVAIFTGRGRGLGINPAQYFGGYFLLTGTRTTSSASSPAAPINVVLNWTAAMKGELNHQP